MGWLLDFLYPPTCPHCGRPVKEQGTWCPSCLDKVLDIRFLQADQLEGLDGLWILGRYQGGLRSLIHDVKFNDKSSQAACVKPLLSTFDQTHCLRHINLVLPIPISLAKRQVRGYNQVDLFFKEWVQDRADYYNWQWLDALTKETSQGDMWHMSQLCDPRRGGRGGASGRAAEQLCHRGRCEQGQDVYEELRRVLR